MASEPPTKKRKLELPPLPESFLTQTEEHQDDPDKHQSRKRSFPHVEGNYPSVVFFPVISDDDLEKIVGSIIHNVGSGSALEQTPLSDLHVSLSRTFTVRHHQIKPLVARLRAALQGLPRFTVEFPLKPYYFENDDHSRAFVSLRVGFGAEKVRFSNLTAHFLR